MFDKFKQLVWISTGGLAVGTIIRRGNDAIRCIPNISDTPLVDVDSLLFGVSLVLLWIWMVLTVLAIIEHKPWAEAKDHWARSFPTGSKRFRFLFLLLRWQNTVATYLLIYFLVAAICCGALVSGDAKDAARFFLGWCFYVFLSWFGCFGQQKKWFGKEPDTLQANAVKLLDLPEQHGRFVVITLLMAFLIGAWQYKNISQNFGGGRPQKVVVFLKPGSPAILPTHVSLEGRVVDLLFRRGSKLGFKEPNSSEDQILVIDLAQIDRLYIGHRITELDPAKLK